MLSLVKDFPALKKAVPLEVQVPAFLHVIPTEGRVVTVESIMDRIDIIFSMQKPKKLTFKGSDGKTYPFLCKPNDDLRKDYRLIELFDLVNELFKSSNREYRPYLNITRFSVTALNEEAGLVEWVPGTHSFRSILLQYYKREGISISFRDIKTYSKNDLNYTEYFVNEILPRFPIVFDKWMAKKYYRAQDWLACRNVFIGSSACMSMLGYIVGLGDRHGENILIQEDTCKAVHVDFNCLFEKGKTFEVPEIVPFRLTRNMLAGFGTPSWRGLFLKCCELTLLLFRSNKDLMQTNMEAFVYDPMLDWVKDKKTMSEAPNEKGLQILRCILEKIDGKNGAKDFASARGQAIDLIEEAINVENLSKMYIGWSAFL